MKNLFLPRKPRNRESTKFNNTLKILYFFFRVFVLSEFRDNFCSFSEFSLERVDKPPILLKMQYDMLRFA